MYAWYYLVTILTILTQSLTILTLFHQKRFVRFFTLEARLISIERSLTTMWLQFSRNLDLVLLKNQF